MLKVLKELVDHDRLSVYLDPEFWENDRNLSFAPLVDYVVNDFPKLFSSIAQYAISKCETLKDYKYLIGSDIKAGFYLDLTDDDVEDKGISFKKDSTISLFDISKYMGVYLKINYIYKLDPSISVPVCYVFGSCLDLIASHGYLFVGTNNKNDMYGTNLYTIVAYLLANSIEFKVKGDFALQDIVVPSDSHFYTKRYRSKPSNLLDIDKAIKELKAKRRETGLKHWEYVKLCLIEDRKYGIIHNGFGEVIKEMTPTFFSALLDRINGNQTHKSKVSEHIATKKEEERKREEKEKEYQERLKKENEDYHTSMLQRIANETFF